LIFFQISPSPSFLKRGTEECQLKDVYKIQFKGKGLVTKVTTLNGNIANCHAVRLLSSSVIESYLIF